MSAGKSAKNITITDYKQGTFLPYIVKILHECVENSGARGINGDQDTIP